MLMLGMVGGVWTLYRRCYTLAGAEEEEYDDGLM